MLMKKLEVGYIYNNNKYNINIFIVNLLFINELIYIDPNLYMVDRKNKIYQRVISKNYIIIFFLYIYNSGY